MPITVRFITIIYVAASMRSQSTCFRLFFTRITPNRATLLSLCSHSCVSNTALKGRDQSNKKSSLLQWPRFGKLLLLSKASKAECNIKKNREGSDQKTLFPSTLSERKAKCKDIFKSSLSRLWKQC